jgi:hypothetical protein
VRARMERCPVATAGAVLLACLALPCGAQSYRDLTLTRNRPSPYTNLLQLRAGLLGGLADDEDESIGYADKLGVDGSVYWRTDSLGEQRSNVLEVYGGRDGFYLGAKDNLLLGQGNQTRLELFGRLWPFYREGYYQDDDFIPTGRYEGKDYGAALSLGHEIDQGMRLEAGAFYKHYGFDGNDDTSVDFTIPDDFNAYGIRTSLEHSTLQLDRVTGWPEAGFLFTVMLEIERNDSNARFGTVGVYESSLPSVLWRGLGHVEWYFPQSDTGVIEIEADGSWSDDEDRVYNNDAQKPIGNLWIDGEVRYRFEFGDALALAPLAKGQWLRLLDQNGAGNDQHFFFGGGLNLRWDFGDALSLLADYSYLTNESREPISTSEDTFGEHRFFIGMEVRFGAERH